VLNFRVVGY
jgi:hypothetical protein